MKNEMEGFVLFPGPRSGYDSSVGLLIGKTYVRLTGGLGASADSRIL